jgi:REP element-mobilizing transposase RayT
MRIPRWKAGPEEQAGHYHCVSRFVEKRFAFEAREREKFRSFLEEYSLFCGVEVLTWCILSNHFHLLIKVPQKPATPPPVEELIERLNHLTSSALTAATARQMLERFRAAGQEDAVEELRQKLWSQMYDLSQFMKLLKQRFSQWFNRIHKREGTLWEGRFRSTLVEGNSPALATVAAYIDLNPVRAGLVDDPKDYRWCGYAEAVATNGSARKGLAAALGVGVDGVLAEYREWLFRQGEEREGTDAQGRPVRRGFTRETMLKVLADGGELPRSEYLKLRIRYLVDGAVLGSREYVNSVFERHRDRFGARRKTGARPVRGVSDLALSCLRDLRVQVAG